MSMFLLSLSSSFCHQMYFYICCFYNLRITSAAGAWMKHTFDALYDAAGLNLTDPTVIASRENGWFRAWGSFLCLTSLQYLPDTLSKLMIWFMRTVERMISSKTGTLPPTRPVLPPCGFTARFLSWQYLEEKRFLKSYAF